MKTTSKHYDDLVKLGGETSTRFALRSSKTDDISGQPINSGVKRCLDLAISLSLIILLLPLLTLIALVIKVDRGPAIFRHNRIGRRGNSFACLKFRSMSRNAERDLASHLASNPAAAAEWAAQHKLQHDPRITRFGKLLRTTSLDELPQLFNVLRGEMSLIGPRPVVREEFEQHYCVVGQRAYAATRPGITGLWQVSGRSETSYAERVRLDISYVNNWSLARDIAILIRTVPAVLRRKGAV